MPRFQYAEVVAASHPISNWSRFFVHPFSDRLLWVLVNYTTIRPNTLTLAGFLLALAAAYVFSLGTASGLRFGAALYYLSFALDTIDGSLARLTGTSSRLGGWFDTVTDYVGSGILAAAFAAGAYRYCGDVRLLYVGNGLILVALFYYFLADATERVLGKRPQQLTNETTNGLLRWLRGRGVILSPLALADFEALYLVVCPLIGYPIHGMVLALIFGGISRMLVFVLAWRAICQRDRNIT